MNSDAFAALSDVIPNILSFLDVPLSLGRCGLVGKNNALSQASRVHDHWRYYALCEFGVYHEDYMRSIDVKSAEKWRLLCDYVQKVHHNVDRNIADVRRFYHVLKPVVKSGSRKYKGSLELADNSKIFFWENGRYVQVIDIESGKTLRTIDTKQNFRRYFHRLASTREKLFVALNDRVVCYDIYDETTPEITLPPPPQTSKDVPHELLVNKNRLILLQSTQCTVWDIDTFQLQGNITHEVPAGINGAPLEVLWMGNLMITWVRYKASPLSVWSIDDCKKVKTLSPCIYNSYAPKTDKHAPPAELIQADLARLTGESFTLSRFIVAALDCRSIVTIWDSKEDFRPVFRFDCGCTNPFELFLTQDFLAVVDNNMQNNTLNTTFWKLWLHPGFDDSNLDQRASEEMRQISVHNVPCVYDSSKLACSVKWIKNVHLYDVDSYFASYRKYLNVGSFHKNGLESMSVYRSNALKKIIHFPPAKLTKFEEWLAVQVSPEGTVTIYDFRPNSLSFDDLLEKRDHHRDVRKEFVGTEEAWQIQRRSKLCR